MNGSTAFSKLVSQPQPMSSKVQFGYAPLEVPVSYRSRGFDEGKKVDGLRDPLTWVRAIIRSRFSQLCDD